MVDASSVFLPVLTPGGGTGSQSLPPFESTHHHFTPSIIDCGKNVYSHVRGGNSGQLLSPHLHCHKPVNFVINEMGGSQERGEVGEWQVSGMGVSWGWHAGVWVGAGMGSCL